VVCGRWGRTVGGMSYVVCGARTGFGIREEQVSGSRCRVSEKQVSGPDVRSWGLNGDSGRAGAKCRVSGIRCSGLDGRFGIQESEEQVSGLRFQVSGAGGSTGIQEEQVPSARCQVSGFWCRALNGDSGVRAKSVCSLPAAYCPLPTAYCLLPTAYSWGLHRSLARAVTSQACAARCKAWRGCIARVARRWFAKIANSDARPIFSQCTVQSEMALRGRTKSWSRRW